jgi:hypothetical protein
MRRAEPVLVRGEKEHYALFQQRDLDELARAAPDILLGAGSTAEKTALLRSLSNRHAASAVDLHGLVLARIESALPEGEALRTFAARRLGEMAVDDAAARAALFAIAWGPEADAKQDTALRLRAAERVGATSSSSELPLAHAAVSDGRNTTTRRAFENGLARNPNTQP